jgi:hypothetical protein
LLSLTDESLIAYYESIRRQAMAGSAIAAWSV